MKKPLAIFLLLLSLQLASAAQRDLLIVVGAAGDEPYGKQFAEWTTSLTATAAKAGITPKLVGATTEGDPRSELRTALDSLTKTGSEELWIVLIGHGSFDGKLAKFNLHGDDISQKEFAAWLADFKRPLIVSDLSAASGPFIDALSGPNRVILTATRSGKQADFAHFGQYFTAALADPKSDLDKDGQTSLLEAFLAASHATEAFFKSEQRVVAEHAMIDDNGDRRGTPADAFVGLKPKIEARPGELPDGEAAARFVLVPSPREAAIPATLRAKRTTIELDIARLRTQKASLSEETYYRRLELLLLDLARLSEATDGVVKSSAE